MSTVFRFEDLMNSELITDKRVTCALVQCRANFPVTTQRFLMVQKFQSSISRNITTATSTCNVTVTVSLLSSMLVWTRQKCLSVPPLSLNIAFLPRDAL